MSNAPDTRETVLKPCPFCGKRPSQGKGDAFVWCDNGHSIALTVDQWNTRAAPVGGFDLVAHLERQRAFSLNTFGPGARTKGVIDHIRKELAEIDADPSDIKEWVDVVLLALDGAWRAGWEPADIAKAIEAKQTKNEGRTWPDWRTAPADKAIEHDRTGEAA
jgi:hypothetical protein